MPGLIVAPVTPAPIAFDDFVAGVEASGFDPRDDDSFAALAPLLAGLSANRSFLGNFALAALEDRCAGQSAANGYGAQVLMLHRAERWFMRACFWPAAHDSVVRRSGGGPFFYGVPHDHDFSFLTIGHLGPGYSSDYFEYDHDAVTGYAGEPIELRFVERAQLSEGKILLYRAHRDVHVQHAPEALSVSLNVMEVVPGAGWRTQYRFDTERSTIAGVLGAAPAEALLALATRIGGEAGRELVRETAARHPSPRMRFAAVKALADAAGETELLERAIVDQPGYVSEMCAQRLTQIAVGRAWIEKPIRNGASSRRRAIPAD